jgi:hypothetical protein
VALFLNLTTFLCFFQDRLMMNVTDVNATEMIKESSLEAIGYICQDIVSLVCSKSSIKMKYQKNS